MMDIGHFLCYVVIMAGVTYLIRMLPLVFVKKQMQNPFVKSFLFYMPYTVLAAMVFPAAFDCTASVWSAVVGVAVGVLLSLKEKPLLLVAGCACVAVFAVEYLLSSFGVITF